MIECVYTQKYKICYGKLIAADLSLTMPVTRIIL
jgi:hypothetical protein